MQMGCKRTMVMVGLAVLLAGCGDATAPTASPPPPTHAFPKGFLWGAATAGFQVDMGCPTLPAAQCDDPHSDWYQWVTDKELLADPITHLSGDQPATGPGFWELWPKYLDAAASDMHLNAFRYSLEWSRLFPDATAEQAKTVDDLAKLANPVAVKAYHQIFQGARQRKLRLLVTLNHYSLPLWLHDGKACHSDLETCKNRGWVDKERILPAITLFSAWCAKEFGAEVDLWGTLNEPFAVVLAGYMLPGEGRTNPPGVMLQIDTAFAVAFHMMEAHARMYDAVHQYDTVDSDGDGKPARVGIVANLAAVKPKDPANTAHSAVVENADYLYNWLFLNAIIKGEVDRNIDGVIEPSEVRADMKGRMDYLGVNYYTKLLVQPQVPQLFADYPKFNFLPDANLFNTYPEGLYEVSKAAWERYKLPIIVTENGTADPKDSAWQGFVRPHLVALHKAIAEGVQVEGYFYWTLMDNFEWNHGMHKLRMGLLSVDTATKAFTATGLSKAYGDAALRNGF